MRDLSSSRTKSWLARDDYRDICKHNHQAEQTSTLNGTAVNVNRLSKPHWWQERLRSAPTTKCVLAAAVLILLALGAPVHADDPIAEWLKQDESDGQNDQVRPDLHALTDQQLQDAQLTQNICEGVLTRAAVSPRLPSVRSGHAIFAITLSKK